MLKIMVPYANTGGALADPTHVKQFVLLSFDYFCGAYDNIAKGYGFNGMFKYPYKNYRDVNCQDFLHVELEAIK
jgi:hypothetical protein